MKTPSIICSGAENPFVPTPSRPGAAIPSSAARVPGMAETSPKSTRTGPPSRRRRTFAGFMSRWTNPYSFSAPTDLASDVVNLTASSRGSGRKSGWRYSIMQYGDPRAVPSRRNFGIPGSATDFSTFTSRAKRSLMDGDRSASSLSAPSPPPFRFTTRYTSAERPSPRNASTRQPSTMLPRASLPGALYSASREESISSIESSSSAPPPLTTRLPSDAGASPPVRRASSQARRASTPRCLRPREARGT